MSVDATNDDASLAPFARFGFLNATNSRLRVRRDGGNIIRSASIPKPMLLVNAREQQPLPLFVDHPNWIGRERRVALKTGDYSIEGMEDQLSLERKSLADLIDCTVSSRDRFIANCARL